MFKMEITLDEQKILQEGKYDPAEISRCIDSLFQSLHIEKQGEGVFFGGDYAGHGSAILCLKKQPWFMPYVDKWLWYNSKGSNRVEDFVVEDVAAQLKRKPARVS